jgi:phosphoglycolate phosphatase
VKPDPASTLAVMRCLDAKPETTLFVGDSRTDVETGSNAGTDTCAVSWGFRSRESLVEAGPDFIADSVAELEAVIFGETP